jgi:hypothetical protein
VGSTIQEGTAYVFRKPAGGWRSTAHPTAALTSDNGAQDDNFGGAVAIAGDTIVVGAYSHRVLANTEQGEAYVYTEPMNGWQTTSTTTTDLVSADGAAVDLFGAAVAMTVNTIVVGAPNHNDQAGSVYVFIKPPQGWVGVGATRTLVGLDTVAGDQFGHAVAITGNTIAVGAPGFHGGVGEGEGAAYVLQRPAQGWGLPGDPPLLVDAELTATAAVAPALLGQGIGISGSEVVAGAYERTVGSHSDQGVVDVFRRPGTTWKSETQTATLVAAGGGTADHLGESAAIGGTTIAAGAPGRADTTGAVYLFTPPGPGLSKVRQSRRSWSLGHAAIKINPRHKPKSGDDFSFSLQAAATVSLTFREKNAHGRLVHRGTVVMHARSGRNSVDVDGKLGHGKKLAAGHCIVTVTAKNVNGTSSAKPLHFSVTTK